MDLISEGCGTCGTRRVNVLVDGNEFVELRCENGHVFIPTGCDITIQREGHEPVTFAAVH